MKKAASAIFMAFIWLSLHLAQSESPNNATNNGDIVEERKQELLQGLSKIRLLVAKLQDKKDQFGARTHDQEARSPKHQKSRKIRLRRRRRKLKWKKAFRKFWRWLRNSRKRRRLRLRRRKKANKKRPRFIPKNREENRKFFHQTFSQLDKNNFWVKCIGMHQYFVVAQPRSISVNKTLYWIRNVCIVSLATSLRNLPLDCLRPNFWLKFNHFFLIGIWLKYWLISL